MANVNDAYQTIAEMWTFPESASFRKMLEAMMTMEDARLLIECREPVTVPELAERLKVDEKSLTEKLDSLYKRGLILKVLPNINSEGDSILALPVCLRRDMSIRMNTENGDKNGQRKIHIAK